MTEICEEDRQWEWNVRGSLRLLPGGSHPMAPIFKSSSSWALTAQGDSQRDSSGRKQQIAPTMSLARCFGSAGDESRGRTAIASMAPVLFPRPAPVRKPLKKTWHSLHKGCDRRSFFAFGAKTEFKLRDNEMLFCSIESVRISTTHSNSNFCLGRSKAGRTQKYKGRLEQEKMKLTLYTQSILLMSPWEDICNKITVNYFKTVITLVR